jgi:uncharacterized membrane protein
LLNAVYVSVCDYRAITFVQIVIVFYCVGWVVVVGFWDMKAENDGNSYRILDGVSVRLERIVCGAGVRMGGRLGGWLPPGKWVD